MSNTRTWHDIGSDVNWIDYGGMWARHVGGTVYHVLAFHNNETDYGNHFVKGKTPRFQVDLREVDTLSNVLPTALDCCGWDDETAALPLNKVHALAMYGAGDILWSESGSNAHRLVRAAKRFSKG